MRTAVLIPCFNEAHTVATVVGELRAALPEATVYVYDNNSTDQTREMAVSAGAVVRPEPLQGKGNVVRRMFADVDADVYVLVDGDSTYDAASAPEMVDLLREQTLDMVTGVRVSVEDAAYRPGHRLGNAVLTEMVALVFGRRCTDMLSGFRVLSRRFVKSFPALAAGFEIETEMTVHALEMRMPIAELETLYRGRPPGSASKLSTYSDGFRILLTIFNLLKEERPLPFFGFFGAGLACLAIGLSIPVFVTYQQTGLVPRFPTAILSTGLMILAFLSATSGLVLDTVTHGRRELKRLAYLSMPPPGGREAGPAASAPVRPGPS